MEGAEKPRSIQLYILLWQYHGRAIYIKMIATPVECPDLFQLLRMNTDHEPDHFAAGHLGVNTFPDDASARICLAGEIIILIAIPLFHIRHSSKPVLPSGSALPL